MKFKANTILMLLLTALVLSSAARSESRVGKCPDGSPTWMDLSVCEERGREGYDRDAFGSAYSSLEDEIRADGTAATDIEHIIALAEAYDSGLAESQFRTFAGDIDNLTIAGPAVNRRQKSDRDPGEWSPPQNRGWFAARVVAVKRKYGLSVDAAERDALQAMLDSDPSRTVSCGAPHEDQSRKGETPK